MNKFQASAVKEPTKVNSAQTTTKVDYEILDLRSFKIVIFRLKILINTKSGSELVLGPKYLELQHVNKKRFVQSL